MSSTRQGGSSCRYCASQFNDDNMVYVHLNTCHVKEFVRLLRGHRLQEIIPNADPIIFKALYNRAIQFRARAVPGGANGSAKNRIQNAGSTKGSQHVRKDDDHAMHIELTSTSMERTPGVSTCFRCGTKFENDDILYVHLNVYHIRDFLRLLRERRLEKVVPKANPLLLQAVYKDRASYQSVFNIVPNAPNTSPIRSAERFGSGTNGHQRPLKRPRTRWNYGQHGTTARFNNSYGTESSSSNASTSTSSRIADAKASANGSKDPGRFSTECSPDGRTCDHRQARAMQPASTPRQSRDHSVSSSGSMDQGPSRDSPWPRKRPRIPQPTGQYYCSNFTDNLPFDIGIPSRIWPPYTYSNAMVLPSSLSTTPVCCILCQQEHPNYVAAADHDFHAHTNLRRYLCGFGNCPTKAKSPNELAAHIMFQHGSGFGAVKLFCRKCSTHFGSTQNYVDHVVLEHRRLRRIHYEQIALRWLDVQCSKCGAMLRGQQWYDHYDTCGELKNVTKDHVKEGIKKYNELCPHRLTDCHFFPSCNVNRCSYSHPICAHHPNCFNYKQGKCAFDHNLTDRTCTQCFKNCGNN